MAEREQRRRPAPRTDGVEIDEATKGDSREELKAELEAAKPNVSQELEVGAESLNGIDAGQNIESSEIPIEEINSKSNTDKTRGKNKK